MINLVKTSPEAVYIHIPFCKHKCYYCDFNTYAVQGQPVDDYLTALETEMARTVQIDPPDRIATIFVGGGTPTILDAHQMARFLKAVGDYFPNRAEDLEFTMEANPGTTAPDKLAVMREGGVNRISFGVQSFNNDLLRDIGRIHRTDEVYQSIQWAREAGFDNLSIDLMFGLPRQTLSDMERSVNKALELDLTHYSLYSLKIEERTLFHTWYEQNRLPLPDEDEELAMYELIMRRLEEAGYRQYEISNFAIPGYESKHNQMYWQSRSYYGLGAGAHGYVQQERHQNIKGVQSYIQACQDGLPRAETYKVSREQEMEDFMMVGLRMNKGVSKQDFQQRFGTSIDTVFTQPLQQYIGMALLQESDDHYFLTDKGRIYGNEVFAAFIGILEGEHH